MSYYQKIKELILDDDDEDALQNWVRKQPLSEQLVITQTIKDVLADMLEQADVADRNILLQQLDNLTNDYNDAVFDEYNATVKYHQAIIERDAVMVQLEETTDAVRAHIIECITGHAPNADAMRELAIQIMEREKEYGLFNPENWKGLL